MSQKQRQKAEQARRRKRIQMTVGTVLAVIVVLVLGAGFLLSGSDDGGGGTGATAFEVSMVEFAFDPAGGTAMPGDAIAVRNDGAAPHSFVIPDLGKGVELGPGQAGEVQLPDDAEPGSYRVICDLPGHIEAGMEGTLEVVDSAT